MDEETIKNYLRKVLPRSLKYKLRDSIPLNIKKIYANYREQKLKQKLPVIKRNDIIEDLGKIGLYKGDTVMVHSSLKKIGYVDGGPSEIIKALSHVLTDTGTLVIPTYGMKEGSMYRTCIDKNYVFDPKTSKTDLGAIPSSFLETPNIERSIHPTHSVSALGKHAKYITESHSSAKSTFGENSPWDKLIQLDGKLLMIGLGMGRNTLSHALEDNEQNRFPLPVRMNKTYYKKCVDWKGNIIEVPVTPLHPKYVPRRIDQPHRKDLREFFWEEFKRAGIINVGKIGLAQSWIASADMYYNHLRVLMKMGITIYSDEDDIAAYQIKNRLTS